MLAELREAADILPVLLKEPGTWLSEEPMSDETSKFDG